MRKVQTRTYFYEERTIAITKKRTISTLIGLENADELSSYSLRNANISIPLNRSFGTGQI